MPKLLGADWIVIYSHTNILVLLFASALIGSVNGVFQCPAFSWLLVKGNSCWIFKIIG